MKRALPVLLVVLAAAWLVLELTRPPTFDTRVALRPSGTEPFDTRIALEQLPALVGAPVTRMTRPAFEVLEDSARVAGRTYLFAAPSFAPDAAEAARLLAFVRAGGTLFVAAGAFGGALADSLGVQGADGEAQPVALEGRTIPRQLPLFEDPLGLSPADSAMRFVAPGLARPGRGYALPIPHHAREIVSPDPTRTTALALDGTGRVVFARIREEQGQVLLLATPLPLTNAALVLDGDGPDLLAAIAAYLPPREVLWDARTAEPAASRSPLRVALASPALRWALGLVLLGVALALAFRARRWQRPIPVVAPPPNAQRAFARTVGRLYFTRGDHAGLARRMADHFLDHLRTRLHLPDADLSDATARRAAARAGVPPDAAAALFADLRRLASVSRPDPADLVALDRRLVAFFGAHADASHAEDTPHTAASTPAGLTPARSA